MRKICYLMLIIQCIIFTGCFNKNLEMSISETSLSASEVDTVFPIPMAISFKYNLDAKLKSVNIKCYKLSDEKEWIEYTGGRLVFNFPEG